MNFIRAGFLLFLASAGFAGPIYNVTDLGTLGGSTAAAFGISGNGWTAGAAATPSGYDHAFVNFGSGLVDLTGGSNSAQGSAAGVNSAGTVAGTADVNGQSYATTWAGGSSQTIAGAGSYAMAINDAGQVAGALTSNGYGNAFVTENGAAVDLGTFGGGDWSAAYGINDADDVAGYGMTADGTFRGFLWTPQNGYTVLGTLGGANSYAMAVNDSGAVAGNSQTATGYAHAFVDSGGVMTDLGTLGGNFSYGYGINAAGDVVGYSALGGSAATHAFLDVNGVMVDLNSLLGPSNAGWVITQAYAINDSNEIVGAALYDGVEHAVLLIDPPGPDAPEPGTLLTAAIGLAAIGRFAFTKARA